MLKDGTDAEGLASYLPEVVNQCSGIWWREEKGNECVPQAMSNRRTLLVSPREAVSEASLDHHLTQDEVFYVFLAEIGTYLLNHAKIHSRTPG